MASLTVTSIKEIRCPIDVVRAQFTDLKQHITNNVHRNLELTLHASDERRCDFTQGYRVLGFMGRDEIRLEREVDGSLHGKVVEGASQGTETFVTFESLDSGSTRVQFKAVVANEQVVS